MTLSGRPLLDTRPDSQLFVDRVEEMSRVRAALNHSLNCLVVGERGSGKTSLVRALMFQSRQDGDQQDRRPPELVYVHGAGAVGAAGLLARAADAIARHQGDVPPSTSPALDGGAGDATELLAELGDRAAQRGRIVIALDDAPAGAGNALFGALRDELWSIDLRWLVTVPTSDKGVLLRPPADAFFESQVELEPLAVSGSIEILRRRMREVPEPLLAEAARIGAGNPRRLLDVARELGGDYSKWSAFSLAASQREKALASLGRSAQMLAQELEELGGASASDEQLLSRMGWTRPRVVQVLAEMEQVGLVTTSRQKSGQGRPRKIYKVVSPAQFVQQRLTARTRATDQTQAKTQDQPQAKEPPA
ncbi:MAG: AAA family ATPase [Actinomycetota bacterium]